MEFFRQRARQILVETIDVDYDTMQMRDNESDQFAYEGNPLPLKLCYQ